MQHCPQLHKLKPTRKEKIRRRKRTERVLYILETKSDSFHQKKKKKNPYRESSRRRRKRRCGLKMLKQNSLSVERFLHFSDTQLPILRGKKQAGDYLYSKQEMGCSLKRSR
jgi:hypothetical protein